MNVDFPVLADYSYIVADGIDIFATHGHNYNMDKCPNLGEGTVLLHGHTHVPVAIPFGNNNVYINPGSVAIPKENSPKSYMIYENRTLTLKDISGKILFQKKLYKTPSIFTWMKIEGVF